jgi:TetR/AcrR family transcriptional regulator, transcriptional repressor for nem operon
MKPLPTTTRGRRTRAAILGSAAQLMHERGMAAASMDDVLLASGAGKSQLYHYFDDRRDLCAAVLQHQFERVRAAQPSLDDPSCTDLRTWRDEVLDAFRDSGGGTCPLGAFAAQTDGDPFLRETLTTLFDRWQQALSDLVRRADAAGSLRPGTDSKAAGLALLTAHQGGTLLAHLHRSEEPLARALDDVIARLIKP